MLAERHNHPIRQGSAVSARSHRQTIPMVQPSRRQIHVEKKINRVTKDNQSSHGENLFLISLVLLRLEVTLKWCWVKVSWLTQSDWHGYRGNNKTASLLAGLPEQGPQMTRHVARGTHPLLGILEARDSRRQFP